MATIETELPAQDNVLIELHADFDPAGAFGSRTLRVTRHRVCRFWKGAARPRSQMPMADIKTARNEPLVGGGRLEITAKNGDVLPVITYSQTVAARFSEAARGIEQLAKGEPLSH